MHRYLPWAALALAAGLTTAHAADSLKHSLMTGVFKTDEAAAEGAIHPLAPAQSLEALPDGRGFRVLGQDAGEGLAFPAFADAAGKEAAPLSDLGEESFLAAVDLTGSGVSDLIYTGPGMAGWKILTNGTRLPSPVQGFVTGFYDKGSGTRNRDVIPADTRDLAPDQNFLAAVGDFLGNGTEQLAYTRPGQNQVWLVGAHGVVTMKAGLKGIEPAAPGPRCHWLFTYRATRKGQRTRMAYYRMGSDHMVRLAPKGMEFCQDQVPLKGHWERLNQRVLDWPAPVEAKAAPAP